MIIAMRVSRLQTLDQHHLDTMARLAWPCSQVVSTLSLTNREAALSHARHGIAASHQDIYKISTQYLDI